MYIYDKKILPPQCRIRRQPTKYLMPTHPRNRVKASYLIYKYRDGQYLKYVYLKDNFFLYLNTFEKNLMKFVFKYI